MRRGQPADRLLRVRKDAEPCSLELVHMYLCDEGCGAVGPCIVCVDGIASRPRRHIRRGLPSHTRSVRV